MKRVGNYRAPRTAWKPGQSGNPGGRRHTCAEVVLLAREYTLESIATLVKCLKAKNEGVRLRAAEMLLNRGWGTPTVYVDQTVHGVNEFIEDFIAQGRREVIDSIGAEADGAAQETSNPLGN